MSKRGWPGRVLATGIPLLFFLAGHSARGMENQTSSGQVAQVDTPIIRLPLMQNPPTIDGIFEEKEWEDASALSSFWYDYGQSHFYFLAPYQTQLQVYLGYDKDNLYICYNSPVYPEKSWLKARARHNDVIGHALYGLQWDDHVELEIRPYHDNRVGFRSGLFKWFANPFNVYSDQYWSPVHGEGKRWRSGTRVRSTVDGERWVLEMQVPLENLKYKDYTKTEENGGEMVPLPPPDGTAYRCWFTRGIGGNGAFFNVFDNHSWNTTKTKMVFDSRCVGFQINDLGPIMEDQIDVELTLKNHNTRSETVQLGFFIENAEGLIYSSYDDDVTQEGLVELKPGEVRTLRLRKRFPGISRDGNSLWFDVRSAGTPAKILHRTRLVQFHSMDGGVVDNIPFRWRRVDVIAKLRPPRKDFDFWYAFSPYKNRLSAVVDRGIYGASEGAKRAVEAKLILMADDEDETEILEKDVPFEDDYAIFLVDLPELKEGKYKVSLLLFDENKRIVGEENPGPFAKASYNWEHNKLGLDDVVWEPYVPIRADETGFETLKHRFTLAPSGLPAQIHIKPDPRELPLELRAAPSKATPETLLTCGRGDQLRAPIRLTATVDGREVEAEVVEPAKRVRTWKSEVEYASALKLAGMDIALRTQYDCDGAMRVRLKYGAEAPVRIERMQLVADIAGLVDMGFCSTGGGMIGADRWEISLPDTPGVIWDSKDVERADLFYSHFVPWAWFGSGDRGFSWLANSDEHWMLDKDGSSMRLERDEAGRVSWKVFFVNHPATVEGARELEFMMLTHPSRSKPADHRTHAWFFRGPKWADKYFALKKTESEDNLNMERVHAIKYYANRGVAEDEALKKLAEEDPLNFAAQTAPWQRFYQLRGVMEAFPGFISNSHTGELTGRNKPIVTDRTAQRVDEEGKVETYKVEGLPGAACTMNKCWQDLFVYYLERWVRIARAHGFWWDETWPGYRDGCLANGGAYLRDPATVAEGELPWQDTYVTLHMRDFMKRLARVYKTNGVPLRNHFWANDSATMFASFGWNTLLVEEACADPKSMEIDNVVAYPISIFRYAAHPFTGLVAQITSKGIVETGDDKVYDRQYIGRALLHDIGMLPGGPHGRHVHIEQFMRVFHALDDFGFFAEETTEFIPYWRGQTVARCTNDGEAPAKKIYLTAYRRPFEKDGKTGYHAVLVVMNENDKAVELPLRLIDVGKLLGGPNTLTHAEVSGTLPAALEGWYANLAEERAAQVVLQDLESGGVAGRIDGAEESYGPLYLKPHDYRLLYARHVE